MTINRCGRNRCDNGDMERMIRYLKQNITLGLSTKNFKKKVKTIGRWKPTVEYLTHKHVSPHHIVPITFPVQLKLKFLG